MEIQHYRFKTIISHKRMFYYFLSLGGSMTDSPQSYLTPQVLTTEVEQLQIVMSETAQDHGQAQQDFVKEHRSNQQLKLQLESNKTYNDELQKQLELLLAERAALQSNTSDIGQTASSEVDRAVGSTFFMVLINYLPILQWKAVDYACQDGFCQTHPVTFMGRNNPALEKTGPPAERIASAVGGTLL